MTKSDQPNWEPLPIKSHEQFRLTYYIPEMEIWWIHENCDFEYIELLGKILLDIGRSFRVQCKESESVHFVESLAQFLLLLNLFSKRITDRFGKDTVVGKK